jgi:hypothetical protein
MTSLVGKTYTARKAYPFLSRGNAKAVTHSGDFSYDITTGEKFKITEYYEESGTYKLVNLSIGAWVIVTQDELDRILRRGETK